MNTFPIITGHDHFKPAELPTALEFDLTPGDAELVATIASGLDALRQKNAESAKGDAGMSTETQKVDVLASFAKLVCFGGTFEPRRVVLEWNVPRSTGLIANRIRGAFAKTPTTATVRRALERAERDGLVVDVGTGEQHNRAINKNAADCKERFWILTDSGIATIEAALAKATGGAL